MTRFTTILLPRYTSPIIIPDRNYDAVMPTRVRTFHTDVMGPRLLKMVHIIYESQHLLAGPLWAMIPPAWGAL